MNTHLVRVIEIYSDLTNDWQPICYSFNGSKKIITNAINNFWIVLKESEYLHKEYADKNIQDMTQINVPINNTHKIITWLSLSELGQLAKSKKDILERIIRDSVHEKYSSQSLKNNQKYQNRIDSDYQIDDYIEFIYFNMYIPAQEEYAMIRGLCERYYPEISHDMIRIIYYH